MITGLPHCKIFICLEVILCMFFFNSCNSFNVNSDEKRAEERLNHVKEVVNAKDTEAFKKMFSSKVLPIVEDLEIQQIFSSFANGMEYSGEEDYGVSVTDWIENDNYVKQLEWSKDVVDINTAEKYVIILIDCIENWNNKEEIGLQLFLIYKHNDEEIFLQWWRSLDQKDIPKGVVIYKTYE